MQGDFLVGDWLVRPAVNELNRNGEKKSIEPKVMDVLIYLSEHAGEVLSKERLIQAVWPDTFVTDDALKYAIVSLRKVLGDNASDPQFIRNIPKRGYQMVAEVQYPRKEQREQSPWLGPEKELPQNTEEEIRPYPGLISFSARQAGFFFGREIEVEVLWEKIKRNSLLGLIGATGSGKSSFIRAGLVPAVPEGWAVVVATPGTKPLAGLALALFDGLTEDPEAQKRLLGSEDPEVAIEVVSRWRQKRQEALIAIDQFEELFTLNPPEVQKGFADLLGRLIQEAGVRVLLSMRDDFLMHCHGLEALGSVFDALTPISPPTGTALRRALVNPAALCGFHFEDEALIDQILGEVGSERGALPLFAFTASRLWDCRDRNHKLLTRNAYEVIGGVAGSLARHAESTLEEIEEKPIPLVRELFRNLVTAEGTRLIQEREELLSVFKESERTDAARILEVLVDARLLVSFRDSSSDGITDGSKIQIAHESLIANWPRLVRWQTQEKEGAQLRDELRQAARIWDQHGRSPDLLWTGTAYLEFSLWRERYAGALTAVEEAFVHSMAEKARRRKRKVRQAVAAAFLIVVAVAAAIGVSRQQAVDAARQSEASKLLAIAQLKLEDDPTEALAYTTASLELADTEACRLFAVKALAKGPPAYELDHGMSLMAGPRFSPEGRRLALGTISAEVGVWNDEGSLLARLPGHTAGRGANAQWTSEDLLLTDAVAADRIRLWSLPEGREVRTIDFDRSSVWRVSPEQLFSLTPFIPEKENLADIVALRSWALPGGEPEELGSLEWKRLGASNFDFTPNGKGLVYQKGSSLFLRPLPVGQGPDIEFSRHTSDVEWFGFFGEEKLWARHRDGLTRIWTFNGSQFEDPVEIPKPETAPESILPDASGRWMWKPPGTFTQLWSLDALPGSRPVTLRRSGSWYVANCDVHPSGDWMACSCGMDRMELWPLPARPVSVLDGYAMIIRPAAFSPDSRWLATSWGDEVLRLWPLPGTGNREVQLLNVPGRMCLWTGFTFDPSGRYLFAVGNCGNTAIFPLDGSPVRRLEGSPEEQMQFACAVSPSGRLVASATGFGPGERTLRVWDVETGAVRVFPVPEPDPPEDPGSKPTGFEGGIQTLLFDGETVLYSAGDGGIRCWDVETGSHTLLWKIRETVSLLHKKGDSVLALSKGSGRGGPFKIHRVNLATNESVAVLDDFAVTGTIHGTYASEAVIAAAAPNGLILVGRPDGSPPHLLAGHIGPAQCVAISPDLKWVASTGEDNTLRLWPMPDLSKPPLHTLPQHQLVAKLKSLTNLRTVPDPETENGWKIELEPFPGWKSVPTW